MQITEGAIQRMYHDDNTPGCAALLAVVNSPVGGRSVVQVLDIKKLASSNSSQAERYRSDPIASTAHA